MTSKFQCFCGRVSSNADDDWQVSIKGFDDRFGQRETLVESHREELAAATYSSQHPMWTMRRNHQHMLSGCDAVKPPGAESGREGGKHALGKITLLTQYYSWQWQDPSVAMGERADRQRGGGLPR